MKEKVAVLVVAFAVLGCFCLAYAQQRTQVIPRIGFIFSTGTPESPQPWFNAFRVGLLDPRTGQPAIKLANKGLQPDGWYDLGTIQVQ